MFFKLKNMTIKREWKVILKKLFPNCFLKKIEQNELENVVTIIDDFTIAYYKLIHGENITGTQVCKKAKNRILYYINNFAINCNNYVILQDEKRHVPSNKSITWEKRKNNNKVQPYSNEEILLLKITDGVLPNPQRLIITSYLRDELYAYCNNGISSIFAEQKNLLQKNSFTLLIDTCRTKINDEIRLCQSKYSFNKEGKLSKNIYQANKIGESDLKMVYHLIETCKLYPEKNIIIRTIDSDSIPILLLNIRDIISQTDHMLHNNIYIDMRSRFENKNDFTKKSDSETNEEDNEEDNEEEDDSNGYIINITQLWIDIGKYFYSNFPYLSHPYEVMCFLIAITKTDYSDNFKTIGPNKVWKSFIEKGFHYFYNKDLSYITIPITMDNYGCPNSYRDIRAYENKLWEFIKSCAPKNKNLQEIEKNNEFYSKIRRCIWVLNYWSNGGRDIPTKGSYLYPFPDPLLEQDDKSLYGWEIERTTKNVILSKHVFIQK